MKAQSLLKKEGKCNICFVRLTELVLFFLSQIAPMLAPVKHSHIASSMKSCMNMTVWLVSKEHIWYPKMIMLNGKSSVIMKLETLLIDFLVVWGKQKHKVCQFIILLEQFCPTGKWESSISSPFKLCFGLRHLLKEITTFNWAVTNNRFYYWPICQRFLGFWLLGWKSSEVALHNFP